MVVRNNTKITQMPSKTPKNKNTQVSGKDDAANWIDPGENGERITHTDAPSYLLLKLSTILSRRFNRHYVDLIGFGIPEVRLMGMLYDYEPLKFKQIVKHSMMDQAQASRTLAVLIRDGYISLHGPNGAATRFTARVSAKLTAKGRKVSERAIDIAREHQMQILEQLSREERKNFHVVLHRLLDWLDQKDEAQ